MKINCDFYGTTIPKDNEKRKSIKTQNFKALSGLVFHYIFVAIDENYGYMNMKFELIGKLLDRRWWS